MMVRPGAPLPTPASRLIHHERQQKMMCGLHALNGLVQNEFGPKFQQSDLDEICYELDPPRCCHLNRHRHWLGLGDYDVNVMLNALSRRGLDGTWFDCRQMASKLRDILNDRAIIGLLVNGAGGGSALIGGTNHWYAMRRIADVWWDLNSLNRAPRRYVDVGEMCNDLQRVLDFGGNIILVRDTTTAATTEGGGGGNAACSKPGAGKKEKEESAGAATSVRAQYANGADAKPSVSTTPTSTATPNKRPVVEAEAGARPLIPSRSRHSTTSSVSGLPGRAAASASVGSESSPRSGELLLRPIIGAGTVSSSASRGGGGIGVADSSRGSSSSSKPPHLSPGAQSAAVASAGGITNSNNMYGMSAATPLLLSVNGSSMHSGSSGASAVSRFSSAEPSVAPSSVQLPVASAPPQQALGVSVVNGSSAGGGAISAGGSSPSVLAPISSSSLHALGDSPAAYGNINNPSLLGLRYGGSGGVVVVSGSSVERHPAGLTLHAVNSSTGGSITIAAGGSSGGGGSWAPLSSGVGGTSAPVAAAVVSGLPSPAQHSSADGSILSPIVSATAAAAAAAAVSAAGASGASTSISAAAGVPTPVGSAAVAAATTMTFSQTLTVRLPPTSWG